MTQAGKMDNLARRVLLVEDSEDDYLIVRDLLSDIATTEYDLKWLDNYQSARESLAHDQYDVCLLDYRLGEATGVDLVREFGDCEIPFILLTGNEDYEADVAATKAGATDYLLKGHINAPLLERSIRYAMERKATEIVLLHAQRAAQASADSMRASEARYRRLFEAAQDGILILDATSGQIQDVNPYLCELLGYAADEFLGKQLWEIGTFRDIAANQEAFCALQEKKYVRYDDLPLATKSGHSTSVEFISNVYSQNGHQVIQCNIRDISERKQAEEKLRQSEANLARAQQMAHLGSWELDLSNLDDINANPLRWSDELFRIFGYEAGQIEVSNEAFFRAVHPDDRQRISRVMGEALNDGKPYSIEHRIILPDGRERVVQSKSEIIYSEETGLPLKMVGLGQDITEQKQAEQALRASVELNRSILESSSDCIKLLDMDANVLSMNGPGLRLMEIDDFAMVEGHCWTEFWQGEAHDLARAAVETAKAGNNGRFQALCPTLKGTQKWWDVAVTPIMNEQRQAVKLVSMSRDITEQKQAEQAIERSEREQRQLAQQLEIERLRLVAAQRVAKVGSWETDLASMATIWSEETHRIFETDPATFHPTHQHFLNLVHPEDRAAVNESFVRSLDQHATCVMEHRLILPDDRIKFVEEHWQVVFDEQENPVRAIGTCQDITSRKQAELLLRESEEHLRFVVDASNDGIWEWDIASGQVTWSERIYTLLGLSSESFQLGYESQRALIHPDDVAPFEQALRAHLETGEPYHLRVRYRHSGGAYLHVLAQGQMQRNAQGHPLRMIGSFSDLTALMRAEAEREARSRDIVATWESMTDAFFSLDSQWRFKQVNSQGIELLAVSREELLGTCLWDKFPQALGSKFEAEYRRAMKEQVKVDFEEFYPGLDTWFEVHAYPSPLGLSVYFRDITQRRQTEEARVRLTVELQRQRQRLNDILSSLPGVVWETWAQPDAANGRINYVSDYVQTMLGYSVDEWLATPNFWLSIVHPDDQEKSAQTAASKFNDGRDKLISNQFRWIAKDGRVLWVDTQSVAIYDASGSIIGIRGVSMDISARKQAEEERDRFFTMSLDMLAIVGSGGYFKRLNPAFATTLGFSNAELMAVPFLEFVHPDDVTDTLAEMAKLNSGVQVMQFENRYRCHDGSYKWLRWMSAPFEDKWYCVAHDITGVKESAAALHKANDELELRVMERTAELAAVNESLRVENIQHQMTMETLRQFAEALQVANEVADKANGELRTEIVERERAEREVQRSQQELQSFIDAMTTLAAKVAPDGTFLIVNKVAFDASGISREEYMKTNFLEGPWWTFDPAVQSRVRDMFHQAFDGTPINYDEKIFAFGEERTINFSLIPIEGTGGQVEYLIAEGRDITELKLTEKALTLAKAEAERANLAKSEFLSRMSHELRTPLNAILGFGQILERQQLTALQHEGVGHVLKGGRHLLGLINEVLDIARVEAGGAELSLEPIDLQDVVTSVLSLIAPLAAPRHISLEQNGDEEGSLYVMADKQRLRQVVINLLANAIKYNREGGQVIVSCHPSPTVEGSISITIRDTGWGIAPEDLPKLFTPFERLSAANSPIEGTGLGLVLSQRLATAMGGTIEAQSTVGQGTSFTLTLPQAASLEERISNLPEGIMSAETSQGARRASSVLCIEDNASNLRLIEAILESRPNVTLLSAIQGSVGLDLARQHDPDLILLDLHLPDIMGEEVLRRLQQSALTRDIPVIVISADATPRQTQRLLDAGARAYLTKPLDVTHFLQLLDEVLQASYTP